MWLPCAGCGKWLDQNRQCSSCFLSRRVFVHCHIRWGAVISRLCLLPRAVRRARALCYTVRFSIPTRVCVIALCRCILLDSNECAHCTCMCTSLIQNAESIFDTICAAMSRKAVSCAFMPRAMCALCDSRLARAGALAFVLRGACVGDAQVISGIARLPPHRCC